jgi:hypothetical protein
MLGTAVMVQAARKTNETKVFMMDDIELEEGWSLSMGVRPLLYPEPLWKCYFELELSVSGHCPRRVLSGRALRILLPARFKHRRTIQLSGSRFYSLRSRPYPQHRKYGYGPVR